MSSKFDRPSFLKPKETSNLDEVKNDLYKRLMLKFLFLKLRRKRKTKCNGAYIFFILPENIKSVDGIIRFERRVLMMVNNDN